ncbi:Endoribonuclease Dicer, partial [Dissophora globulifera]
GQNQNQNQSQNQDQDQDSLDLLGASLIPESDATPLEACPSDRIGSYSNPIVILDDPSVPVELTEISLTKSERPTFKKRRREEDANDTERVDFTRPLNCAHPVAVVVGSSFIKLTVSLHVFTEFPAAQENRLTHKRSEVQRLQKLRVRGNRLAMADIGNEFLRSGFEGGLVKARSRFSGWKGIEAWRQFDDKFRHMRAQAPDAASDVVLRDLGTFQAIEQLLGYVFKDKRLLEESLTYSSTLPNYERLEYLGDTVVELVAAAYWVRRFPINKSSACWYLIAASVSNVTLGAMCLRSGVYHHINYVGRSSMTSVFNGARANVLEAKKGPGLYWSKLKVPKILADIMESLFGAVFLDSGCEFGPVCDLFMRLLEPELRHLHHGVEGS